MANIAVELARVLGASYGEEVRGSIHDAIQKMNSELESAIDDQLLRIDDTLTISGQAADAKKTGDFSKQLVSATDAIGGLTGNEILRDWVYGKRIDTTASTVDLSGSTANNYSSYAYQVIDCQEGDIFTLSGSSSNGSYRLWCWCDSSGNVISKPTANLTYSEQVISCPEGATKLLINTSTSTKYFICKGEYLGAFRNRIQSKEASILDPDDFEGTDTEKITAAMNAVDEFGQAIILIRRQYVMTANVIVAHRGSANARLIFMGIGGSNAGFDMGRFGFQSIDGQYSYGALSFINLRFTATNIIFDVGHIIRLNFENCVFDGFNHVIYTSRFAQTFYFIDCLFRNGTGYICHVTADTHSSLIDVRITGCLIEKSKGVVYGYGMHGVYITNCCIEGNDGIVANIKGDCRSLIVRDCYFESQNVGKNGGEDGNGVCFDLTGIKGIVHTVDISNNCFLALKPGNKVILLPYRLMEHTKFTVTNNFLSPAKSSDPEEIPSGAFLVAAHGNAVNVYRNLYLGQNCRGFRYDPNHLIPEGRNGDPFIARLLVTNYWYTHNDQGNTVTKYNPGFWYVCDDLDELYDAGYYQVSADIPIEHSPVSGEEFYIINIRSNSSVVQLAITSSGIKSRIGTGEWV